MTKFIKDGTHGSFQDVDDGIPLLSAKDIKKGRVIIQGQPRRISESDYESIHKKYSIKTGDILLTIVGSIGRVAVVTDYTMPFTFQRSVAIIRLNNNYRVDYVNYFLQSPCFQNQLYSRINASAQGGVYLGSLKKLDILVPPSIEQKNISKILSTVDESLEKTDAIIEETRQLKKGLMQKLFTEGIGHTRFKDWDRSNLKGSRVQISSVGSLPESWGVSSIGDIALDKKGSVKIGPFGSQLKKDEMVEEGIRVFGQENVFNKDFRTGTYFITKEKFETLKTVEIFPNDIVLTMMGTIGDCCVVPNNIDRGIMDSHLMRIQVKNFINPEYVARLIRESYVVKKQVECFSQGAIMSGLNLSLVKEILLPIPPIEEQNEIENILSEVDAKIEKEEATKAELEQLKKGLMQVLLTGKVRVKA